MSEDELEKALGESKRAAQELVRASARLTKHLLAKAEIAAKDPKGSATKAVRKVSQELEAASREVDRILREL
jgi:hypothetical protein